tara:strand:- start:10219 stop:11064 length:846 start_codon:yes stop_codon:yes gene_type:complete
MAQLVDIKKDFDSGNKFTLDVATHLASMISDRFRIIVKYESQLCNIPNDNKINILFSTSRETHDMPDYIEHERVAMVFQHYAPLDSWGYPSPHKKIFPAPAGYFINDIESMVEEIKPLQDREYDFCFIGQIPHTGTRDMFKRNLDKLIKNHGDKFNCYVKYTSAFGTGLDHQEYLDVLNNSKLCLCPHGAFSAETFRFFEAVKMGCIPVVNKLPKFWYYQNAPIVFAEWPFLKDQMETILNSLQDEEVLNRFTKVINTYNEKILNPQGLATLMKKAVDTIG